MLSKTMDEEGAVKTVTLARGTRSGASSPLVMGTPSSVMSIDSIASSRPYLYDGFDKGDPLRKLLQISILELLDKDDRPTFIIDMVEPSSPGASFLRILYANNALRGTVGVLEQLSGESVANDPGPDGCRLVEFHDFKRMLHSHESTPASAQSYQPPPDRPRAVYAGLEWTWSTFRKRFRIVKGVQASGYTTPSSKQVSSEDRYMSDTSDTLTRVQTAGSTSPPTVTQSNGETSGATGYFDSCASRPGAFDNSHINSAEIPDYSAVPLLDGVARKLCADKAADELEPARERFVFQPGLSFPGKLKDQCMKANIP